MNRNDMLWLAGGSIAALTFWTAIADSEVEGSGQAASEHRAIGAATVLEVEGDVRIEMRFGDEPGVELTGDDNLLPLVETQMERGRLLIRTKEDVDPALPLVARVTLPRLTKIEGSGAVDIDVSGIEGDALDIELSGSGEIVAKGKVDHLRVDISGSGEANLEELQARAVELDLSGSADVDLGAPETLDVDVSGSATVRYSGDPDIDQDISGSARLVRR
jgi:hypothetical protein